ncbi:MAG: BCD family MFS transporter [Phycisphaerales bacterium]|nr:BCD family MFS transporter [Hyphomonadaceae bacterium]
MSDNARPRPMTWRQFAATMLPFADSATRELPLPRLLRLALFQVSVGMAAVLLTGTLNRVMIVELGISGWVVALMVALPLVFAPLRALIGFKSDTHRSVLGWRRGPYIWFGSMLQFGGFAIMPFALLILSGDTHGPVIVGHVAAALAFLLVGVGMHTTQTAGLALASDLAPEEARPRVVALLYVMLLAGMLVSSLVIGLLLTDFSALRLIQVIQGAAVVTMALNMVALWKQEIRDPVLTSPEREHPPFAQQWRAFISGGRASRLLVAVGLGAAAFSMQDVLLEPYGAQVLGLSVAATTALTALWSWGTLSGLALAAHRLGEGAEPHRLAGFGAVVGIAAFSFVIFAAPINSTPLFLLGVAGIGFGGGLFAVGTLTAAMALTRDGQSGLALGAWGAVQATAAGVAIALGGALRDVVGELAESGRLGAALSGPATGYGFVYHLEIGLLFAALIAIGPLARHAVDHPPSSSAKFGLAEFPT